MRNYILIDRQPVHEPDFMKFASWYGQFDPTVAKTLVAGGEVSTVFLGVDHNHSGKGPPILFETLVFGGPADGEGDRYATWAQAAVGHAAMVERVRAIVEGN